MNNFDSLAESRAITARLFTLAEARVYRTPPTPLESYVDGSIKPYIHVSFSTPVPMAAGRSIGHETTQPFLLPVSIACVAAEAETVEDLAAEVFGRLLGWSPTVNNSSPLKGGGGTSYSTTDRNAAVIRETKILRFECIINLAPTL